MTQNQPTEVGEAKRVNLFRFSPTNLLVGNQQPWNAYSELGVELFLNLNDSVSLSMSRKIGGVGGYVPSGSAILESCVSISENVSAILGFNITIHYPDSKVLELGLNESSLAICYLDTTSGNWTQLPSTVDTVNNTVTAYTDHLSNFAIIGTTMPLGIPFSSYLPFLLFSLFTPSGLNPLIYLVLGLVGVAVVTVAALGLRGRREEQVSEVEAQTPTRYRAAPTPRRRREEQVSQTEAPNRYERAPTPIKRETEVPKPNITPKVSRTAPTSEKPKCVKCGHEVPEDAKYCPVCGSITARCSVCNQYVTSEEQFLECPNCGVLSHRDHLLEWVKVKGYCPSCKKKLSQEDLI